MAAKLQISSCVAVGEGRENGLPSPDESYLDRDEPRSHLEFSGISMCIDAQLFKPVPIAIAGQRDGWVHEIVRVSMDFTCRNLQLE